MTGRPAPGGTVSVLWRWTSCTPGAIPRARGALRCALDQLGYHGELVSDAVLAASELIANATEHAVGPYALRLRRTAVEVICEVVDHDPRIPEIPEFPKTALFAPDPMDRGGGLEALCGLLKERGRGLQIVDHLTGNRWGFRLLGRTKIAWAAFSVNSPRVSREREKSDTGSGDSSAHGTTT